MEMALTCFKNGGVDVHPIQMWENTLQNAQHYVKTAYGTLKVCHQNTQTTPIIGPGQGSRGAVAACASTTSVAIKAYNKLAKGFLSKNPRETIHYKSTIKMFVDDASKYSNMFNLWIQKIPSLEIVKKEAQIWEKYL